MNSPRTRNVNSNTYTMLSVTQVLVNSDTCVIDVFTLLVLGLLILAAI